LWRLSALLWVMGLLIATRSSPPFAQVLQPAVSTPVVILLRHAEKAAEPEDDPPLTSAGAKRAQDLAVLLQNARVSGIITTQFLRTKETAQPLAAARGIAPEAIQIKLPVSVSNLAAHVAAVTAAVQHHADGVVVVIGHDITLPAIVGALGGPRLPDICESRFGNLFVILPSPINAPLVHMHYGDKDPEPGPNCI
jgi:broad specificity phosphatase PhoE